MQQDHPFDRLDLALSAALGLLSLALYVRTLVPWLLPGDSGEFQVLLYQVGIAHTTGYPVYVLLGKLFLTLVPFGDVAYRANLFSAFMAAVTVALVYVAGRLATDSRWGGVAAGLALAVSYTFWSQALIAEVYTPGAAFLAAVLVALWAWERTGRAAWLFGAGLLGGLGLGVHASVGIFAPAVALYLALRRSFWRGAWKPAAAGALAGLILYGLAFLAVDRHAPPANIWNAAYGPARSAWGLSAADLENPLRRILFVGTGRQWRTAWYPDPPGMARKIGQYVQKFGREFSPLAVLLAAAGFLELGRRAWSRAMLIGAGLLVFWLFYFNYHVGDIYVFYIPGYLLLAVLVGAGLAAAARLWAAGHFRAIARKWPALRSAGPPVLVALMALALYPVFAPHLPAVVKGEAPFLRAREYPANPTTAYLRAEMAGVVKELEQGAIVFVDWSRLYPLYYAAQIDAGRFDLQFIEARPRNETGRLADSTVEFACPGGQARVAGQGERRPVYFVDRFPELERAGCTFRPVTKGSLRLLQVQQR